MHVWWSTQSWLATLLSSLIARRWFGLQTLWRIWLKDLSISFLWFLSYDTADQILIKCEFYWWDGRDLMIWLFGYSVLFTVESLSLLYHLYTLNIYIYIFAPYAKTPGMEYVYSWTLWKSCFLQHNSIVCDFFPLNFDFFVIFCQSKFSKMIKSWR